MQKIQKQDKGFTLLELLIVIAILAVLATIVVIVLNPVETLAKSRDIQRLSDLATLKSAIALYMTTKSNPQLDGTTGTKNDKCVGAAGPDTLWASVPTATAAFTIPPMGFTWAQPTTSAAAVATDGTGWIPVKLSDITGGTPISNLPLDPINTASAGVQTNATLMYRYACYSSGAVLSFVSFEIDAKLESAAYITDDNKASKDGGNNSSLYEVGTKLDILPATDDF